MSNPTPSTGLLFSVTFVALALPPGTNWSVTFNGSSNSSTGGVVGFSAPNGTYPFSVGAVPGYMSAPPEGNVSVNDGPLSENITFSPFTFSVTFNENGLPGATNWGVTVGGMPHSTFTTQISLAEANGTYSYSVTAPAGFTPSVAAGNLTVANASLAIGINFSAVPYAVHFSEIGLTGTNWSVNLSGTLEVTSGTSLSFVEPNGSYTYSVGPPSGYFATPPSGFVVVAGAPVTTNITFATNPLNKYTLTFNETGLAPGTRWWVNLTIAHNSSVGPTLVYLKANGSFPFTIGSPAGYAAHPSSGVALVNGTTFVNISFTAVRYPVNFTEQGLLAGTNWSVELGASRQASTTTTVEFQEANGTLPFAIEAVPGFRAAPLNGSVEVSGAGQTVPIVFTALTYTLTFTETGLVARTNWSVTVAGQLVRGNGTQLALPEPNGSYAFSLGPVPGFVALPSSGNVSVQGSNRVVVVAFTSFRFAVTFSESGLPNPPSWSVTLAGDTRASSSSSLAFVEPNGTYAFQIPTVPGYTVAPSSGNLTVTGASIRQALTFTPLPPGEYAITFTESGLPTGGTWSVDLGGTTGNSSSNELVFDEENNTYNFSVANASGLVPTPSAGQVTVAGAGVSLNITFSTPPVGRYTVTFQETGLVAGTNWSVSLNGTERAASSATLVVATLPPGSYAYSVSASGYTAQPTSGNVTVVAGPVTVTVAFSAAGPAHSASAPGTLSVPTLVFLGAMGIVVVSAVAIAIATRGSRRDAE